MSIEVEQEVEILAEVPELISDHEEDLDAADLDAAHKFELCLSLLDFPDAQLDAFFNLPPLTADGGPTRIPAAYIRDAIPRLKVDPKEAWDYLIMLKEQGSAKSIPTSTTRFPMHEIIWNSQCLARFEKQSFETSSEKYVVIPVHRIAGFKTLIKWLYSNDEDALYEDLLNGIQKDENYILDFCTHVRSVGCVNTKIRGVIRAIYEEDDDDDDDDEEGEGDVGYVSSPS